jgi:hypothetical protein
MSFADFKKRSQSSINELTKKIEETNKKESFKDDRFWRPELDKSSNGYAVIRFLPASEGEDLPWAKYYSHGFQGKGGWFIENCPTTLGQKCPVCESNSELWNSGIEKDKDIARNRKRRLHYVSNIMVITDPANPQNEGKVFLYKFGKKIFDKINESMNPEFDDEEAINPFDFWAGANFKLKVRKVAGYINYDKSEFESTSVLLEGTDEWLEDLWGTQYKLAEFTDTKNFKSYDELKTRRDATLGADIRQTTSDKSTTAETISESDGAAEAEKAFGGDTQTPKQETEEGTDALSYFEKLANE